MSTGCRHYVYVRWITFLFMVVTYLAGPAMAIAHTDPYVSEFEFLSRFHPSQNPDCMNKRSGGLEEGNGKFQGSNFGHWRSRRSPEEESPVGQEPSIEVRAILVRCPRTEEETDDVLINRNIYNITAGRSQDILDFHGFDRDEPGHHSEVRDCRRKLIITMKFNNIGKTKTHDQFVVIDHVLDPVTMHKSRLLNPFVVKVRQEPVLQLYGLKFQGLVNAEAREDVINKKLSNFTGCDDGTENPTCGQMFFEGKPIPYSQGFCCSCDPELNVQREASLLNDSAVPPFPSFFSKSNDRRIRPFKSPRSVNENFLGGLSDFLETSQNEAARNFNNHFVLPEDDNLTLSRNLHEDETDLINLKNSDRLPKKKFFKNRVTDSNAIVHKNTFEPYKKIDYQKFLSQRSNISRTSNKEEKTTRKVSPFHNSHRINLTAELIKLEEDYKNLQLSSLIKAEVRNNKNRVTEKQKFHSSTGKYSEHIVNDIQVDKSLSSERFENKSPTKIINVLFAIRPKQVSTCTIDSTNNLLTKCLMERATIQSIPEIVTPVVLRQKVVSDKIYPSGIESKTDKFDEQHEIANSKSMELTTNSSRKFGTDIIDEENVGTSDDAKMYNTQLNINDRIHFSIIESQTNTIDEHREIGNFKSVETTTVLSREFGTDIVDEENIGTSYDAKTHDTQSNIFQTKLREMYEETSSGNSINTSSDIGMLSTVTSEGTTNNLKHTNDPGQSFDKLFGQVERPTNSESSFSSGNRSKGDAILLSGSLKNQLANWLSYDKRKNFAWETGRKKSREDNEIGYNDEVRFVEMAIPSLKAENRVNRNRYDDQLTSVDIRRPTQINLKPDRSYETSYSFDNGKSTFKTRDTDHNISMKTFLDYIDDPEEIVAPLSKKSGGVKLSRPYRSIVDDDSFSNNDNERQRRVDEKIEDGFIDISEALKDDADNSMIISGRPNNESTVDKDDSVIEKLDLLVNKIPAGRTMSHLRIQKNQTENSTAVDEKSEGDIFNPTDGFAASEMPQTTHLSIDKLNTKKINDTNNTKVRSSFFKQANRDNNYFQPDDRDSRSKDFESYENDAKTKIYKHTEEFSEPVSEIALTTEHQIIVDRFKIVKTFKELPENYKGTSKKMIQTTNGSPKMRDLMKKKSMPYLTVHRTSIDTDDSSTEKISKIIHTLGPQIIVDRFIPVKDFEQMIKGPLKMPHAHEEEFLKDNSTIVISGDRTVKNDISLHPVLMIENLKKQLRNEAKHYSTISTSTFQSVELKSSVDQKQSNFEAKMRETKTELTPAEKIEDLITDQETLPPDEETKFTTTDLSKTMIVPDYFELKNIHESLLPKLELQDFVTRFSSKPYEIPKMTNKTLNLLEESSSEPFLHVDNKRFHKKRRHQRHQYRRISRNKRRSIESNRNITRDTDSKIDSGHFVINGKNENENDDYSWYNTTTNIEREISNPDREMTTKVVRMDLMNRTQKNLKRREIPADFNMRNQAVNEPPNKTKFTSSSGKFYVSLSRIPENNDQSKLAGLTIEEIPKVEHNEKAEMADDVWTSMMKQSSQVKESPGEIDEMPIFQRTEPSIIDGEPKDEKYGRKIRIGKKSSEFIRKIRNAEGIEKRNVEIISTPKFRSIYPKSNEIDLISETVVDEVTDKEGVERNNKRDDTINSYESEPGSLIFYDYDAIDAPVTEDGNYENKRSLDFRKKNNDEFPSSAKTSEIFLRRRNKSATRNHFGRSNNEEFGENSKNHKVNEAKSFTLPGKKGCRSMNTSGNEFRIKPSGSWKEKMELLKLKKHADVLKEYLNWHHDIVPVEPNEIFGYTTKISITDEKETTNEIITTRHHNVINENIFPSTSVIFSSVTDDITKSLHDEKTSTPNNNDAINETETPSSFESSSISSAANNLRNCSFEANNTEKMETSTSNLSYETEEKASNDNEASTGRILRPCCLTTKNLFTICPTGHHKNVHHLQSSSYDSQLPKMKSKEQLNNVENDLVIISAMEKNRLGGKNVDKSKPKIYRIREDGKHLISQHRRYKFKKDVNHLGDVSKKGKPNRRAGRRLMSVEDLDYNNNEDLIFDDLEENVKVETSVDEDNDTFDYNRDSEKLKNKWNLLIDKIIRNNTSVIWKSTDNSNLPLEFSDDNRSAMKQLHFINADKYIRQMAKRIAHNNNSRDRKDKISRFGDKNTAMKHLFGRKLKSYTGNNDSQDSSEKTYQDQSGRDFAISLSGKIHVEGGTNGQPMSISFDTSPEISNRNEITKEHFNESSDVENSTEDPNRNVLSSLFNIASVPMNLARHSSDDNFNFSASSHGKKNDAMKLRLSRENYHRRLSHLDKKSGILRKSRSVDEVNAVRFPKYRDDRSFDSHNSHYLEDIPEESNFQDYSESLLTDNNDSDLEEADNSQLQLSEQRNLNSKILASDADTDSSHKRYDDYSPDVKVIKIIPLDLGKTFPSSESIQDNEQDETKVDRKTSRMTASQLPKMDNELVPGKTVKPGDIKPAELPWMENDDNSTLQGFNTQQDSKASGSCRPKSESTDGSLEKNVFNADPVDKRISTSNSVNLKVIGLVTMEQPLIKDTKNQNDHSEIVPLIHVKIGQLPNDESDLNRNYVLPARLENRDNNLPSAEGCPEIQMKKSTQHFHGGDSCSCSNVDDDADKKEENCNPDFPEVATMSMDIDEELREPIGIGSCSESNTMDGSMNSNFADDEKYDRIRPTEKSHSCGGQSKVINNLKTRYEDVNKSDARKTIRLKNMLAMMEFMKKMKEIIGGEKTPDITNVDNNNAAIKLASVAVLPIHRLNEISDKIELDQSTDRVVTIGEDTNHGNSENDFTPDENQSEMKKCNGTSSNLELSINGIKSNTSNWKAAMKDQDKSFLFYGNNANIGEFTKNPDSTLMDNGQKRIAENANVELEDQAEDLNKVDQHNTELLTKLKESKTDKSITNNSTNSSIINTNELTDGNDVSGVKNPQTEDDSREKNVLEDLQRKINSRLRGLRKENLERNERRDVDLSNWKKKQSVGDDNFPTITKTKRHRLRLNRMTHGIRDSQRQILRSRSLPVVGDISRLKSQKFPRLVEKRNPKGKRKRKRKKKKKMKKRRKKKKKHKKKKNGKNLRETEIKGKNWWPFRRQLMSLSEKRKSEIDRKSYDDQMGGRKIEEYENRVHLKYRNRRRVHRAKFPHGKRRKMKKRRKHKKLKKKGKQSKTKLRNKRQIKPGGTQVRGGQNCMDRRHPSNVNPAKYLESAHCLRFSDLWYSVYELENPIMEHTIYLQLFEKHNRADGTAHWEDLTQGSMVRMGSFTKHQRDSTPTIVFTYSGAKTEPQNRALNLDPSRERLLVPSPVPPNKASDYPEVKGGSGEYLVVKASAISKYSNECDKAGVGFEAFSKQQDRCGQLKGSCLKNQPLAYWRHDMEARESGRPGCYFLSNFASVPTKPIKYNVSGSGSREYLGLEYHSTHVSAIDIEVRTDYNAIVRVGSSGRVTEVYVDSTALEHTVVTLVISNMGLASSPYQPRITDCPTGLPVSWTKAKGIMQVIPPQHDQTVTLDLYGRLLLNGFHCSVEVINHRGELVAMRRIRVQKMDRCFCVWHCLCACIGSVSGMGCQPMSPEHYHAAGFQGPVPVVITETSILMNAIKNVLMLSALLVLLLLILGMLKWFVGMFAPVVGRWGLESLLEGSKIEEYLEPELRCRCVMTDEDGWPVHPDTGQRTVRLCSRKLEFVLNLIFFLTYPIAVCCTFFKRSLNSSRQRRCCPDESKMCLINEKGNCPKMICVSTYGDNRNSKLEADDTRYVMNELKKSQESLQNPKRKKKKDLNENGPKNLSKKSLHKNKSASDTSAKRLIDDLLKSRMVFRNLMDPIGGLRVPSGTTYSLRGYFLNAEDGGYRFITPCPFKQYWLIEKNQKSALKPPENYPSSLFMRSFVTARDVYESNELSLKPKGICINVQYQDDT